MNDHLPAGKSPSLLMSSTAIEQVKQYQITKERVLDVLRNRTSLVDLGNNGFQFSGSPSHPTTYITAQRSSDQQQWIITNIEIVDQQASRLEPPRSALPTLEPPHHPDAIIKSDQQDRSLPVIAFTKHAQNLLKRERLDHRTIEHILHYPDKKEKEEDGKVRFIGSSDGAKIHVIATFLDKENKWLVITVELRSEAKSSTPTSDDVPKLKFTNHALERMKLRDVLSNEVRDVIQYPEKVYEDDDGKLKFIGAELDPDRAIHVVAKFLPDENTWLIITTYVRGEEDDGSLSKWKLRSRRSHQSIYSQKYQTAQPSSSNGCINTLITLLIVILIGVLIFMIDQLTSIF